MKWDLQGLFSSFIQLLGGGTRHPDSLAACSGSKKVCFCQGFCGSERGRGLLLSSDKPGLSPAHCHLPAQAPAWGLSPCSPKLITPLSPILPLRPCGGPPQTTEVWLLSASVIWPPPLLPQCIYIHHPGLPAAALLCTLPCPLSPHLGFLCSALYLSANILIIHYVCASFQLLWEAPRHPCPALPAQEEAVLCESQIPQTGSLSGVTYCRAIFCWKPHHHRSAVCRDQCDIWHATGAS